MMYEYRDGGFAWLDASGNILWSAPVVALYIRVDTWAVVRHGKVDDVVAFRDGPGASRPHAYLEMASADDTQRLNEMIEYPASARRFVQDAVSAAGAEGAEVARRVFGGRPAPRGN